MPKLKVEVLIPAKCDVKTKFQGARSVSKSKMVPRSIVFTGQQDKQYKDFSQQHGSLR